MDATEKRRQEAKASREEKVEYFRQNLVRLMEDRGMRNSDLALAIYGRRSDDGMPKNMYSIGLWMTGRMPKIETILRIAAVFGVPVTELMANEPVDLDKKRRQDGGAFRRNLLRLMDDRGMTITDLAAALYGRRLDGGAHGVTHVATWTKGRHLPYLASMHRIAKVFGVPIEDLMSNHTEKPLTKNTAGQRPAPDLTFNNEGTVTGRIDQNGLVSLKINEPVEAWVAIEIAQIIADARKGGRHGAIEAHKGAANGAAADGDRGT